MTLGELLQWAKSSLDEPADADYLLCGCLNQSRSYLYTWPDKVLSADEITVFRSMIERRVKGEPVAYILGKKPFWSFSLLTSPDTLIPRPETELLVEAALEKISAEKKLSICDLGTGTGAVALAIASERPNCNVIGVDRISNAVALAKKNAQALSIGNVCFLQSNWFDELAGHKFDVIVSNPPYVEQDSPYLQEGDVRFEPKSALTSGIDGLEDIREIVSRAGEFLSPKGWLMFEHGFSQHQAVANCMKDAGFVDIQAVEDLNLHQRLTIAKCIN
ncbi:peptide chain release factor N(5)-glutamine methyltransferase [Alteromonas sp. 5E99-2]|uniref:peptide chain release factor N(5)-glutamine methyltransferase n=1 Tax=Alteromonas sp. 5E99-2 TaxID=2817683 RepID=UPI001A9A0C43|nr:peptide chain release factor N(5)-glutamine methyltransferase [Alteromonas sp. 5E99-2]MBO1255494.1 peptide chain release factor N(5)-glutamine methyltransferase [Alteromonas sp. 5E99-2]